MYIEICAELGEAIAAASSTPGIQFHLIMSLLEKHDKRAVEKAIHRIVDRISKQVQVTFGHLQHGRFCGKQLFTALESLRIRCFSK